MFRARATPINNDICRQQDTAQSIKPPDSSKVSDEREEDGEGVEDDVGHGVLCECLDRGVADEAAPEPAEALDDDGGRHDGDGGNGERDNGVVGTRETRETFDADLAEGRDHDDGEDEDADGLETPAAHGVCVAVLSRNHPGCDPDDARAEEVEGCVDQTGDNGEGRCHDCHNDLEYEECGVCGQVGVERHFDNGTVRVLVFLGHPL
jgi:hypothetical protein